MQSLKRKEKKVDEVLKSLSDFNFNKFYVSVPVIIDLIDVIFR